MSINSVYGSLAIDMMGSDYGPLELLRGVRLALQNFPDSAPLILVGDADILNASLEKHHLNDHPKLSVFHASQVIEMEDKPVQSLKQKRDSSMVRALELIQAGAAAAVLSCGNTGSLMAGSTIKLRPIAGVERPTLASIIPSDEGHFILSDVGANPQATPRQLTHNALLTTVYCQKVLKVAAPRVGLLSIGTEEGKGNELVQKAHEELKRLSSLINYVGLLEGFHLFGNHADVIICDGFVGNILLKSLESLVACLKQVTKRELLRNPLRIFGTLCARGAFQSLKYKFNSERYGAAPLLGLNGTVLKGHGSSDARAISHGINIASRLLQTSFHQDEMLLVQQAEGLLR